MREVVTIGFSHFCIFVTMKAIVIGATGAIGKDLVNILLEDDTFERVDIFFRRDYRRLVESYESLPSHPRVILIAPIRIFLVGGIPLMGLYPETMEEGVRPAIREMAAEKGLELVDLKALFKDSRQQIDGVHPQRKGTRMLADAIYSAVRW